MTKLRNLFVGAALACSWACGGPENATVDQFFRAAQSDDSPTLAAMSAVSPPGNFDGWTVVEATSRVTEPYALPDLVEKFDAAKKERDEILEAGRKMLEEEAALDEIVPKLQEDPEYEFSGERGEIQKVWVELVATRKEKERAFQDARRAKNDESGLATKSMMNRGLAVEELDGEVAVSKLLVNLKPVGEETELPFTVTLHKYDLASPSTPDRIEGSRWVIVSIEGANDAARTAAAEFSSRGPIAARDPNAPARTAPPPAPKAEGGAPPPKETARAAMTYQAKELRGLARVQILTPETKIEGNDVVSTVRVRNISKDWITRFTATEYWYDEAGTATRGGSRIHDGRFMPDSVIEMELRTAKNDNFYQNQIEFKHANGEVDAIVVRGFPKSSEE